MFTGLFGHFKGTVKDLTFQDCAVSDTQGSGQAPVSGSACVGVLAGYVWGADARIENCTVADSAVTSDAQRTNPSSHGVGALAGRLCTGPTVTDCTVENVTVTGNR